MKSHFQKLSASRAFASIALGIVCAASTQAADSFSTWFTEGKGTISFRPRYEFASFDSPTLDDSYVFTLKSQVGYATADWNGFSALVEMVDVRALDDENYNAAGLNGQPGHAVIADPETTELNQFFLNYKADMFTAKVGRQRLILDNARFVGNVGWRQNEQTFDAASIVLTPAEGLKVTVAYLDKINRIFADERDYDSESFLGNVTYTVSPELKVAGYVYQLDLNDSAIDLMTYGGYASGTVKASDSLSFNYYAEVAFQENDNNDADTMYYHLVAGASVSGVNLKLGYEVLGSDDGTGQFLTPLATAHKFNGFADAYLNNGGAGGLQDIYLSGSTKFGKLTLIATYHDFSSDEEIGGVDTAEGSEIDLVAVYPLTDKIKLLAKFADYSGDVLTDRTRFTFQADVKF